MKRSVLQFTHGRLIEQEEEITEKKNTTKNASRVLSHALSIGGAIALPIAGGALLGVFLDGKFHTSPLLTLSLLGIGIMSAFYSIIRLMRDIS